MRSLRESLLTSTVIGGVMAISLVAASPASAQDATAQPTTGQLPVTTGTQDTTRGEGQTNADGTEPELEGVVVTGSRIVRQDYVATSPIATVTGEQAVQNGDITLDTFLNNLPQVNPAGTTTSNNPSNAGQSNVNLRGLGANRNLVLIDGRRGPISQANLAVDLNTIPQAMIDRIEVITGGAGATYGADALAGVVNVILKNNFQGVDVRANYSNSTEFWDSVEYQFSAVIGGNFGNDKGNMVVGFDRSFRENTTKAQREFSAFATSTTGTPPQGAYQFVNAPSEAAVDAVFAKYGSPAAAQSALSGRIGFNKDGTLIFYGQPGPGLDVVNFKDPIDATVNQRFFPDFYSYNFDAPNLLTLPLDRYSFMTKAEYRFDNRFRIFATAGWTEYIAAQGLAPTPVPSVVSKAPGQNSATQVSNPLVCGAATQAGCTGASAGVLALIVPVTNPFISADFKTLLNSRTGDDPDLVGSGATEPFRFVVRPTIFGLRQSNFENTVVNFLGGVSGPVLGSDNWNFEAYVSESRTEISNTQTGNIDTQKLTNVLADPTSSANSACATYNPFGTNPIPQACINFLAVPISSETSFRTQIGQAFIRGDLFDFGSGPVSTVFGVEYRNYDYSFAYLSTAGPISGFNVGPPDKGETTFNDIFAEALVPLVRDLPFVQNLELGLGWRRSTSQYVDELKFITSPENESNAYKVDLSWEMADWLRTRFSYQRAVRAPNFNELFVSSNSFPQVFDPCSVNSRARQGPNAAQLRALCIATGVTAATVDTFVGTPNAQLGTNLAGNSNLGPETGDTITLGVVVSSPWENQWLQRLRGSIDYYDILVEGAILALDTNAIIASCYNYYGTNPNFSAQDPNCLALKRAGGQLSSTANPNSTAGTFPTINGGELEAEGIDFQVDYGFDWDWLGLPSWMGSVQANLLLTHVMSFTRQEAPTFPVIEYAGTVSYFGAGLGTSSPEWKANLNTLFRSGPFDLNVRGRYISSMENRQLRQFPGEVELNQSPGTKTGVPSIWYWDVGLGYQLIENVELRLGVNNLFDEAPPLYGPNVQSGTDPSTYDVIGRRVFSQIRLRF
jgi:outer membrane receptor protein involved in Fe transport